MKKFFYSLMIVLAGLSVYSCKDDSKETGGKGAQGTAPVLGEIQGAVLDASGADITTTYEAADFGQSGIIINYALFVDKSGNKMAGKQQVTATIGEGRIAMTQSNLSLAIQKLGIEVGEEAEVDLALYAYVGSVINSSALVSNYVTATFTPCAADIDDNATYDRLYIIGALNTWNWDKAQEQNDFIYDYGEDGIYSGLVYYRAQTNNIFKIAYPLTDASGNLQWDDKANYGTLDGAVLTPEEYPVQLRCDGGSGNIDAFAYNFYVMQFDRNELTLTVREGHNWEADVPFRFDYLYLCGVGGDWTEFKEEFEMKYIPSKHKFCIDVETAAESEFKFLADGAFANNWYLAWGQDESGALKVDGANIKLPAGKNRVYFDINRNSYSIEPSTYGTDEGQIEVLERERNVERPKKYYLRGSMYGDTEWANGLEMSANEDNTVYSYDGLEVSAEDMFKIVIDNNWASGSFGAASEEPITLGTAFAAVKDGKNIKVGKACGVDVVFNVTDGEITVTESKSQAWTVIGMIGDSAWDADFAMSEKDGVWTSESLEIKGDFKIRKNGAWSQNRGVAAGATVTVGTPFDAERNGGNITGITGSHVVVYDSVNDQITIK